MINEVVGLLVISLGILVAIFLLILVNRIDKMEIRMKELEQLNTKFICHRNKRGC